MASFSQEAHFFYFLHFREAGLKTIPQQKILNDFQ